MPVGNIIKYLAVIEQFVFHCFAGCILFLPDYTNCECEGTSSFWCVCVCVCVCVFTCSFSPFLQWVDLCDREIKALPSSDVCVALPSSDVRVALPSSDVCVWHCHLLMCMWHCHLLMCMWHCHLLILCLNVFLQIAFLTVSWFAWQATSIFWCVC